MGRGVLDCKLPSIVWFVDVVFSIDACATVDNLSKRDNDGPLMLPKTASVSDTGRYNQVRIISWGEG